MTKDERAGKLLNDLSSLETSDATVIHNVAFVRNVALRAGRALQTLDSRIIQAVKDLRAQAEIDEPCGGEDDGCGGDYPLCLRCTLLSIASRLEGNPQAIEALSETVEAVDEGNQE